MVRNGKAVRYRAPRLYSVKKNIRNIQVSTSGKRLHSCGGLLPRKNTSLGEEGSPVPRAARMHLEYVLSESSQIQNHKGHMLYDSIYRKCSDKQNSHIVESGNLRLGVGVMAEKVGCFFFWVMKMF